MARPKKLKTSPEAASTPPAARSTGLILRFGPRPNKPVLKSPSPDLDSDSATDELDVIGPDEEANHSEGNNDEPEENGRHEYLGKEEHEQSISSTPKSLKRRHTSNSKKSEGAYMESGWLFGPCTDDCAASGKRECG